MMKQMNLMKMKKIKKYLVQVEFSTAKSYGFEFSFHPKENLLSILVWNKLLYISLLQEFKPE